MSASIYIEGEQLAEWIAEPLHELWQTLSQQADWPRDIDGLSNWLYMNWYSGHVASDWTAPLPKRLVARIRTAHAASSVYETDWTVEELRPDLGLGAMVVARGQVRKVVSNRDYYALERPFAMPQPGQTVGVTARQDTVIDGSWRTWNGRWGDMGQDGLARFYWSVPFSSMPMVASTFTRNLTVDLPWMLKMVVETSRGSRLDSTVLYVQFAEVGTWRQIVSELYSHVKDLLGAKTPPLTRPLAPGLAVAEDPGTSGSFGEDRCRQIAAVVAANPESLADLGEFARSIHEAFRLVGLDLRQPDRRAAVPTGSPGASS